MRKCGRQTADGKNRIATSRLGALFASRFQSPAPRLARFYRLEACAPFGLEGKAKHEM